MKKSILFLLTAALLTPVLGTAMPAAETYDHSETYAIAGFDTAATANGVFVYPNDTESPRTVSGAEYNFRYAKLMIFDQSGALIEAGGELVPNTDGTFGSPQLTVTVPPHGFLVAFGSSAPQGLRDALNTAMEGAMLYNATMSVIYPMYGNYDRESKKLTVSYDDPAVPSENTAKYLFVGNSTTYFNGTPIKFKGLANAAGKKVDVTYCTFGSAYLSEFADETHERGKALREKLASKKYDYVVLQDAGSAGYNASKPALDVILPLIKENGAQALLYMRYAGTSTAAKRLAESKDHYDNYSALSAEFGLEYAPAVLAFLHCTDKYPEINLYADDNSHHSAAGSYLIACTWLQSYLGIDPRGNTYTANLSAETAAALQECAYLACTDGYAFPEADTSMTVDGVKYQNVALGKPYTVTGEVYTGNWTDADENGTPLGKRTDGEFALSGDDTAIGCWSGNTTSMTVDLGETHVIKALRTDLWGNTWGIPDPNEGVVSVAVSADGKNFESLGEMTRTERETGSDWKYCDFTLVAAEPVSARYVRVTYSIAGRFCWSSEVGIYGEADTDTDETSLPDAESSEEPSDVPSETVTDACSSETPAEKSPVLPIAVTAGIAAVIAGLGALIWRKKKA